MSLSTDSVRGGDRRGANFAQVITHGKCPKAIWFYIEITPQKGTKRAQAIEKLKSVFLCEGQLMVEMFCHSKTHVKDMF